MSLSYISPSSFALYNQSPDLFYQRYLSPHSQLLPREPQTRPMAIGSAFDAYIKSYLFSALFGPSTPGSDHYSFDALFTSMVEEHNRDWALPNGEYVFQQYKQSGVLQDLLTSLLTSKSPRFEFSIYGQVSGYREGVQTHIATISLGGKPDLSFIVPNPNPNQDAPEEDIHVILDFKVNGFLSKNKLSPTKGYVSLKAPNLDYGSHRGSIFTRYGPLVVNSSIPISESDPHWATQMTIYAWITGSSPGSSSFIAAIDQLVCNDSNGGIRLPTIKVASHRSFISERFQTQLFSRLHSLWEIVSSSPLYFFRDLSLEDSLSRQALLDEQLISSAPLVSNENDAWLQSLR